MPSCCRQRRGLNRSPTEFTTIDRRGQPIPLAAECYYRPGSPCIDRVAMLFSDPVELRGCFDRHWRFLETAETGLPHPIPEQLPWTVAGLDLRDDVLARLYLGLTQKGAPVLPCTRHPVI
jgi:hypothetical protein